MLNTFKYIILKGIHNLT